LKTQPHDDEGLTTYTNKVSPLKTGIENSFCHVNPSGALDPNKVSPLKTGIEKEGTRLIGQRPQSFLTK
jgi:hypothetical protein